MNFCKVGMMQLLSTRMESSGGVSSGLIAERHMLINFFFELCVYSPNRSMMAARKLKKKHYFSKSAARFRQFRQFYLSFAALSLFNQFGTDLICFQHPFSSAQACEF